MFFGSATVRAHGRSEVPVEQQRTGHRGGERRPEPAQQGCRHRERQEQQHVVGEAGVGYGSGEEKGEQDRAEHADQPRTEYPGSPEVCPARHRQSAALARLVVRDEVDIEVGTGVTGDRGADARPEDVLPAPAPGGTEDDLGGVRSAGEVEEGGRYVVADDMVEGAAEVLDQGALEGQLAR